jgi:hypothetical protein
MHSANLSILKVIGSQSRPMNESLLNAIDLKFGGRKASSEMSGECFFILFALLRTVLGVICIQPNCFLDELCFAVGWSVCYFPFDLVP